MTSKVNLNQILSTDQLLTEVATLLTEGYTVTILCQGNSMLPFIRSGKDSVVLQKHPSYHVGDIVLARIGETFLLHRIYKMTPTSVHLMGDGNVHAKEVCTIQEIYGAATHIIRNGQKYSCTTPCARTKAKLWRFLLPIRRILLFVLYLR